MTRSTYPIEVQQKVIELHTREKLGVKSIAKWFNDKPGRTCIVRILSDAGVYRGPVRMAEQRKAAIRRQREVLCWIYQTLLSCPLAVIIPDDVVPHDLFADALAKMGVRLLVEAQVDTWLKAGQGGVQESSSLSR